MNADRDTQSDQVLLERTAISAFRIFVRQTGVRGITFGNPSHVAGAGDVSGWAFSLTGETVSNLPRDGSVTTPGGISVRIHIDDLGSRYIARVFPCIIPTADTIGQTVFF